MHTMEFLSSSFTISGTDDTDSKNNSSIISAATKATNDNKIHTFVFIYMDGCGHCEDTEAAWLAFTKKHANRDDVKMFAVNHEALSKIKSVLGKESPSGFPTLYHVYTNKVTEYSGDRSLDGPIGLNKWLAESAAVIVGGRRHKRSSRRKRTERRKRRRGSKRYKKKTMRRRRHNRK